MANTPAQPAPDPSIFHRYLLDRYTALKTLHPSLGRRALLLLAADEFWSLDVHSWAALAAAPSTVDVDDAGHELPPPPWAASDGEEREDDGAPAPAPGIVLRTDYSGGSNEAWAAFCRALREAEREFLVADQEGSAPDDDTEDVEMAPAPLAQPAGTEDAEGSGDEEEAEEEEEGDSDADADADADTELALFSLVSDPARYDGISNLRALRLLFPITVRAAPVPTPLLPELGSGRRQQQQRQHRLTCLRGLQEAYDARGRTLWIFDARSRADGCARLVSEAGDVATGDSWRARATHMAELQANLAARALRIDFGGLDRWDYAERQRNMSEADAGYVPIHSEMS